MLIRNYKDEWIPAIFKLNVYNVIDENGAIIEDKFLTKVDAYIMRKRIQTDNKLAMDKYEYLDHIESFIEKLKIRCKRIIGKTQLELDLGDENKEEIEKRNKRIEDRLKELEDMS